MSKAEEILDQAQNKFHDLVHEAVTQYDSEATQGLIDQAKGIITDALANIRALLDGNTEVNTGRVVNPPAEVPAIPATED